MPRAKYGVFTPREPGMVEMIALRNPRVAGRTLATIVLVASLVPIALIDGSPASANVDSHFCAASQLAVAITSSSGANFAAGNVGIPFVIVNTSKDQCVLEGYPRLVAFPSSYRHHKVRFTNGGGMIFVAVKARPVIIPAGATASFGVDYGDAYNQGDPNGGPCLLKRMTVYLPTESHPYAIPFSANVELNFCYTGFQFEVTAIQSGPTAKRG